MKHQTPHESVPDGWIRPVRRRPRGGRRSGVLADLQLTCASTGYEVEVLARDMERPRGIEIAGQITWTREPHVPASGVRVALLDGPGPCAVAEVRTNAFGEFTFDRRSGRSFGLRVGEDPVAFSVLVWEPDL